MKHVNGVRRGAALAAVVLAGLWLAPMASARPHVNVVIAVPGVTVGTSNYYWQSGYWGAPRVYVRRPAWVYYGAPRYRGWYPAYHRHRYYRPEYRRYHRYYHHRSDHRDRHWRHGDHHRAYVNGYLRH